MKFVLDTNIFNRVLDGDFSLSEIPDASGFVATTVQVNELEKTPDPARRAALLECFGRINSEMIPPAFSFDIAGAGWDQGKWADRDDASRMHADLEALKHKLNNWEDSLIAAAALEIGFGLATSDQNLAKVAKKHGICVHFVKPQLCAQADFAG